MNYFSVSQEQIKQFGRDGFLMVERLFDAREIGLLEKIARADKEKASQVNTARDARGGESRLWLSSETGREDIYNGFCHGRRIIDTMEKLLDDEVYLYHYKMIDKEPRVGGAWEWHQDYGYWYNKKCLFPDMASCMIAVDHAHRGNGCFQVMRGSHKLGRIEHGIFGTQAGPTPSALPLPLNTSITCIAKWNPEPLSSSTQICCTDPTTMRAVIPAWFSSAVTTPATTPAKRNPVTRTIPHS